MRTVLSIVFALFALLLAMLVAAALFSVSPAHADEAPTETTSIVRPISAIAVSQCGLAVALFIQLDATHLLRADPRQSDLFTNVDGKMVQSKAAPMKWDAAYELAATAVLTSHVTIPCTEGPAI